MAITFRIFERVFISAPLVIITCHVSRWANLARSAGPEL